MKAFSRNRSLCSIIVAVLVLALLFDPLIMNLSPIGGAAQAAAKEDALDPGPAESSKPVELVHLRTETAKVFGNPDGTYRAEVSLEPVHYKEGALWLDIDNALVPSEDGTSYKNRTNKFSAAFPKTLKGKDSGPATLFTYTIENHTVAFGLNDQGASKESPKKYTDLVPDVAAAVANNKVTYSSVYSGVDFAYALDGSKVKENIRLNSYDGKNTFEFAIKAQGLGAAKKDDGSIEFTDKANGKFLFKIPHPYMFDSNKENGAEGVLSTQVT